MNRIYLIVFSLIISTTGYSQTSDSLLTIKNLKKLFKTNSNNLCSLELDSEWSACFRDENNYLTADTIQLYSDKYHYLKGNYCNLINWTFTDKSTMSISKTKVCQEPPISSLLSEGQDLKIKLKKEDSNLVINIYRKRKLKDKFVVLSIDSDVMYNGKCGYRLTIVRQKTTNN